MHPADGQPWFFCNTDPWHMGQPHTDVAVLESRLYIVLQEIVPDSTSKTPEEQVAMLPPEYQVPSTITEVTKDILVFRKTGRRCNGSVQAACTERIVKTDRVGDVNVDSVSSVGIFDRAGLLLSFWGGGRGGGVGVGASRKF